MDEIERLLAGSMAASAFRAGGIHGVNSQGTVFPYYEQCVFIKKIRLQENPHEK